MKALDARLLTAHLADDRPALVRLYEEAADRALQEGREEAGGFYLTHAYIYALELGDPRAANLRARLIGMGRES